MTGVREAAISVVAGCAFVTAAVQAAEPKADSWQFEITPYLFGSALSGTAGVANVSQGRCRLSFGDILENLDSGFMAMFEARNGAWGFGFDGMYFRLKDQKTRSWQGPAGIGSATGDLEVMHRLLGNKTKVDLVGAARYTQLDTDCNLVTTTGPLLPGGRAASAHRKAGGTRSSASG